MTRLTQKDRSGNWMVKGLPWEYIREGKTITEEVYERLYGVFWKLMEYEDTGLDPEQIWEMDELFREKCQEVAELRGSFEEAEGITVFPAPHVKVSISNEMRNDFKECLKVEDAKDCNTCSWDKVCIGEAGMCTLLTKEQILGKAEAFQME